MSLLEGRTSVVVGQVVEFRGKKGSSVGGCLLTMVGCRVTLVVWRPELLVAGSISTCPMPCAPCPMRGSHSWGIQECVSDFFDLGEELFC